MMSGVGTCFLSFVAFLSRSWWDYTTVLTILSLLSTLTVLMMPESSLWLEKNQIKKESQDKKQVWRKFIASRQLLGTSFLLSILFSGSMMSFYGLSLSINSVNGNIFLNFFVLGLADAGASLVLVVMAKYIKRIRLLMIHFFGVGFCCIVVGCLRYFQVEIYQVNLVG